MMKSISLLLLLLVLSAYEFKQQTPSTASTKQPQTLKIVSVIGSGTATGIPDIAKFTITITAVAGTSKKAQSQVSSINGQVLKILQANSIQKKDIRTSNFNIGPAYNYTNGTSVLVGQQSTQSVSVIVRNISAENGAPVGTILDQLVAINGIIISGITFDIQNKNKLASKARSDAYADAFSKAEQFANLSGLRLGAPQRISDSSTTPSSPRSIGFSAKALNSDTTVSVGTYDVVNNVNIDFILY